MKNHEIVSVENIHGGANPTTIVTVNLIDETGSIKAIDKVIKITLNGTFLYGAPEIAAELTTATVGSVFANYF